MKTNFTTQARWCLFPGAALALWMSLTFGRALTAEDQSGRALLDKARDFVAGAPVIRRVDTSEQTAVAVLGQSRIKQPPQTNVVILEIQRSKNLAREVTMIQGQKVILLKQGERAAMKLGAEPWKTPCGPFKAMAKDLGNLFVCENETPETATTAPVWKLAGTEVLDGREAFVVQSVGNTAVPIAQERMTKGMAKGFGDNLAQRPGIRVLEYSSRHWIDKSDYRHLRALQVSQAELSLTQPDGKQLLIELSNKTTSEYGYENVPIEVPREAQEILAAGGVPCGQEKDKN